MAKLGHSFWLQLSALLLLSCSSESPMGIDGTLVRLHLTGADLSQVTKANLHITATDSQNQMKVGDSTFTSAPFDVLGVTFPPGAVAATTYHVEVFGDASCLLAQGDAMLTIDHDGQYDVSVQMKAPDLPCGAPAAKLIVQIVNGIGGAGSVTSQPAGISCGTDCDQVYAAGTQVTLHAAASMGMFQGWSGGCSGQAADCTINLSAAGEFQVQAVFANGTCHGWCEEPSGTTEHLYSIWGTGPLNIVAVGAAGTILKWDGQAWGKETSGVATALRGITIPRGDSTFIIVGDKGTILKRDMTMWTKLTDPSSGANLNGVSGDSKDDVFIVGDGGSVLKGSAGGGFSLKGQGGVGNPPSDIKGKRLNSIYASPSNDNFALVGDGGYNLRRYNVVIDYFSDGAAGVTQNLNGVYYGSKTIFAVGANATLARRGPPNGFGDWPDWTLDTVTPAITGILRGVWGISDSQVYAVGDNLMIVYWDGSVWAKVPLPNIKTGLTRNLNAIWGTSGNNLYAVGDSGTILHYLP